MSKRESINSFRLRSSPHRKAEVFLDPRSPGQFVGSNWATIDTVQTNQTTLSAQPPHIIFMRISSIEFVCCCFSPTYLMSHPCSVVSANNKMSKSCSRIQSQKPGLLLRVFVIRSLQRTGSHLHDIYCTKCARCAVGVGHRGISQCDVSTQFGSAACAEMPCRPRYLLRLPDGHQLAGKSSCVLLSS